MVLGMEKWVHSLPIGITPIEDGRRLNVLLLRKELVSQEVIPETHRYGHKTPATLGLMLGFGVMSFSIQRWVDYKLRIS
jgi:hypothetical protein